jgi:ribosomal protein S12 methylthiotransferase accessory factor YcaO
VQLFGIGAEPNAALALAELLYEAAQSGLELVPFARLEPG